MNVASRRPSTTEQFLAWEERQELRYGFDGVRAIAMAGGTAAHAAVQRNLIVALGIRLRGKSCQAYGSNLKIRAGEGSIRYPDAFVICTPVSPHATAVSDPVVIFEILRECGACRSRKKILNRVFLGMMTRPACHEDRASIWSIIGPIIQAGETYTLDRSLNETEALAYWLGADKETFVAEADGVVLGTYYMRPNQAGGGSHVCNCGYMTSASASGRGVARTMCEHSLEHAKSRGYRAMQFNFVVSSNERAVRLWQAMGFEIVGRLPLAFHHPRFGYVDALVLFQPL